MSDEARTRIARTIDLDRALGRNVARMVYPVFVAFGNRGGLAACDKVGKPVPPDEWIKDRLCFRDAMFGAIEALGLLFPDGLEPEDWNYIDSRIRSAFDTRRANQRLRAIEDKAAADDEASKG
jgi:hypothetical protein